MRPVFGVVAVGIVVATHFAFLLYLSGGGFLAVALRRLHRRAWRAAIAVHVAAVGWAAGSVTLNLWCPLTALERWARAQAGMAPLDSTGFIDHYLTGVFYPAAATGYVQAAVFAGVMVSWAVLAANPSARRGVAARRQ